MENYNAINTQNLNRDLALKIAINSEQSRDFLPEYNGYSVGLSSGTSGNRGLFTLSANERAQWAGYIIGKILPFGLNRHKVAFFLRANNNLYETVNGALLRFRFFDLIQNMDRSIKALNGYSPSILIAPASVLRRIAETETTISPKRIFSVAEVLEQDDKNIIENKFGVRVEQVYQCTEGFLGITCEKGSIHLNEDAYIIEKKWIDKATGRFSPIVTDLNRNTQPIVRYLLNDILIEDKEKCACGSSMTRIQSIEGRCDDVLTLAGKDNTLIEVFSDFIRNTIISSSDKINQYRVTQTETNLLQIELQPLTQETQKCVTIGLNQLWDKLNIKIPQYRFMVFSESSLTQKQRRVVNQYYG